MESSHQFEKAEKAHKPANPDVGAESADHTTDDVMHESPQANEAPAAEAVIDYRDLFLRTKAEMSNLQRKVAKDMDNARKYAVEKLLEALLPVADSLDQALQATEPDSSHYAGVSMTTKLLRDTLGKFGVECILPEKGTDFDPHCQEAMLMQADPMGPDKILQVVQAGYRLHERVIRPARVIVSSALPEA